MGSRKSQGARMSGSVSLKLVGTTTALLFLAMVIHAAPLHPPIPAIQFTYSEGAFHAVLAQWQADGVARFARHFAIDFPFLVSYGFCGYLFAAHFLRASKQCAFFKRSAVWSLPAAAIMDAAENLFHLHFIRASAAIPEALYGIAGAVATLKWLLIAVFIIVVLFAKVGMRPLKFR